MNQIATAIDGVENAQLAGWTGANRSIILNIQRQPGANVIAVADAVKKLLPQLKASLPQGMDIRIVSDRTETILRVGVGRGVYAGPDRPFGGGGDLRVLARTAAHAESAYVQVAGRPDDAISSASRGGFIVSLSQGAFDQLQLSAHEVIALGENAVAAVKAVMAGLNVPDQSDYLGLTAYLNDAMTVRSCGCSKSMRAQQACLIRTALRHVSRA